MIDISASAAALPPIVGNGQVVAASTPLLNLFQTWNSVPTPFTAALINITDTNSAAPSLLLDLQVGGASKFNVDKFGSVIANGSILIPAPNGYFFAARGGLSMSADGVLQVTNAASTKIVNLALDASNILALRTGLSTQTFRAYQTFTDASNGIWGLFDWTLNPGFLSIGTDFNGTGASRGIQFVVGRTALVNFATSGHMLWNTDNSFDVGANGANRPRNLFVAGTGTFGGTLTTTGAAADISSGRDIFAVAGGQIYWNGRTVMTSPADGVFLAKKNAGGQLTFGTLPSVATAGVGARAFITDCNVAAAGNFGAVAAGGGANAVPVYADAGAWRIG